METASGSNIHDEAPAAHMIKPEEPEEEDEKPSALVVSSREPPAPRGVSAGSAGGGGGQTAEEQPGASSSTPLLLYPVNTERFFTTSTDGKTYLKIAPASGTAAASSEKLFSSGSDFSSKAVLSLIEAVGRRWSLYETRERSQLFQSVQEEMASKGHVLPVEKIRRKWNNLIVTYKRVKDRTRESGHAKTSWEFFDLMDATLCDTVGSQTISHKRTKPLFAPVTKIVVKPPLSLSTTTLNQSSASPASIEGKAQATTTSAVSSMTTVTVNASSSPQIKPLIFLNGDLVATSLHSTTTATSSSFVSPSTSKTVDLTTARFITRKAPTFTSGIRPLAQFSKNYPGLPTSTSTFTSPISTSASVSASSGTTAQSSHKVGDEQTTTVALFREILKRQEEQVYLDAIARRRMEAREKRRERREVRMAESMGRVATALELLSSKQDTVIALLQRLADRK